MIKCGLVGNPNSGKTSLFNELTGLHQKVGNYPGVTVDTKQGRMVLESGGHINLIDFPGAYSLHSNTSDEFLLTRALLDQKDPFHPDVILYVVDIQLLDKQLLLLTQILDLHFPVLVCLSNCDQVDTATIEASRILLEQQLDCTVIPASIKTGFNLDLLRKAINSLIKQASDYRRGRDFFSMPSELEEQYSKQSEFEVPYQFYLWKHYGSKMQTKAKLVFYDKQESLRLQVEDTMSRYRMMDSWMTGIKKSIPGSSMAFTERIDALLTRPVLGIAIFTVIMFLIFQAIFSWASIPMDFIEEGFSSLQSFLEVRLPHNGFTDLILNGIIPGLSGVMVFIPQIAILFFLISWMEELGYMARVVYLFDHILKSLGLNGRSLIGLISGGACAIPAIMSTRTISNKRDRLVTMFVIPLIPCSARIPVYTTLIGFIVPYKEIFWIFNSQGLAFMALYSLGILMALFTAFVIKYFVKSDELSYLALQLPDYRWPRMNEVLLVVYNKVRTFVVEAGLIILVISMILWFLASFSWKGELDRVEADVRNSMEARFVPMDSIEAMVDAQRLEHSFAGKIGQSIEPFFEPLGFDWKISIALITSFAAREVFVGTMSTIYSLGSNDDETILRKKMTLEVRDDGTPFYDRKTSLSLILFYAFAMQCMSTFAIMWKETKSRRWPILQFLYMGTLAYVFSWMAYHWF